MLDVFRPVDARGRPLPRGRCERVVRDALRHCGRPYAAARLAPLAWRTWLRHKLHLPLAPLPPPSPAALLCTELVLRAFAANAPLRRGRPRRLHVPFPRLDWRALWHELRRGTPPVRPRDAGPPLPSCGDAPWLLTLELSSSPSLRRLGPLQRDRGGAWRTSC